MFVIQHERRPHELQRENLSPAIGIYFRVLQDALVTLQVLRSENLRMFAENGISPIKIGEQYLYRLAAFWPTMVNKEVPGVAIQHDAGNHERETRPSNVSHAAKAPKYQQHNRNGQDRRF